MALALAFAVRSSDCAASTPEIACPWILILSYTKRLLPPALMVVLYPYKRKVTADDHGHAVEHKIISCSGAYRELQIGVGVDGAGGPSVLAIEFGGAVEGIADDG